MSPPSEVSSAVWYESIVRIADRLAPLSAIVGFVLQLNDLLDLTGRIGLWLLLACYCSFRAFSKPTMPLIQLPVGYPPTRSRKLNWTWGTAALGSLLVLAIDLYANWEPFVEVDGPYFNEADPDVSYDPQDFRPKGSTVPVVSFPGINATRPANSIPSDTKDFFSGNEAGWLEKTRSLASVYVNGLDVLPPMDLEHARSLYNNRLGEHFTFYVRKTNRAEEVIIHDLTVTVHNYVSTFIPPLEFGTQGHRDVIVVEVEKRDEPLPWTFSAKYILDDPEGLSVTPWGRKWISLKDGFAKSFIVKVGSKDRGIFVYTADLVVKNGLGKAVPVPLVKVPRSVWFMHGRPNKPDDLQANAKLMKEISKLNGRILDVPVPDNPDPPPAPAPVELKAAPVPTQPAAP